MANTFKRKLSRAIGTSAIQVGTYAVGGGTTAVVIGLTVTNISGSAISANVFLNDGAGVFKSQSWNITQIFNMQISPANS